MLVLLRGDYPYRAEGPVAAQQIGAERARNQTLGKLMVDETDQLLAARAISTECHRVMLSCFNMVPAGRPTAAALLADPWFTAGAPYPQPVRPTSALHAPLLLLQRIEDHRLHARVVRPPFRSFLRAPLRPQPCAPPPVQTPEDLARVIEQLFDF